MRQTRHMARREVAFSMRLHPEETAFWEEVAKRMGQTSVAGMLRHLVTMKAHELGLQVPELPAKRKPPRKRKTSTT